MRSGLAEYMTEVQLWHVDLEKLNLQNVYPAADLLKRFWFAILQKNERITYLYLERYLINAANKVILYHSQTPVRCLKLEASRNKTGFIAIACLLPPPFFH